ncbi:hypothetical protein [Vibrio phage BONAISHI]|nr:hypothetical protein [Vibrio phage BONAISHI]
MKPYDLGLFQATGSTRWLSPRYVRDAITDNGITKVYEGPKITGGLETDEFLMTAARRGIEKSLDSIPYDSLLRKYVDEIENPADTKAFMSPVALDLLVYVYRSVVYENARAMRGQPGLAPGYANRIADHASDLTFSALCFAYMQDHNRLSFGPNIKTAEEIANNIPSFQEQVVSRAEVTRQHSLFLNNRFNSQGLVDGLDAEMAFAMQEKQRLTGPENSLSGLIAQGESRMVQIPEVVGMEDDFTMDLDRLERLEKWSDETVIEAREAYYREKETELAKQAQGKQLSKRIASSLSADGKTMDPNAMMPSSMNASPQQQQVGFEESQSVQNHEDIKVIDNEAERFPEFEFKSGEVMYTQPNQYTMNQYAQQPQGDPYNQMGQVRLPSGQAISLQQGTKLLVDKYANPILRADGQIIAVAANSCDCRTLEVSMGNNGQPIFSNDGNPYVTTDTPSGKMPFPIGQSQQAEYNQCMQNGGQTQAQSMPPQQQQYNHQASDPWAHLKQSVQQQESNAPATSSTPQQYDEDLTLPAWKRKHKPAVSPASEAAMGKEETPSWNGIPMPTENTTAKSEVASPAVSIGANPFNIVLDDVEITACLAKDANFRALPAYSFEGKVCIDERKHLIALAMLKNGKAVEIALSKREFMDRKDHDPYYLSRNLGEMTAIDAVETETDPAGLPDAKVTLLKEHMETDNAEYIVTSLLDEASGHDTPIMLNLTHQNLIPGASVLKDKFINLREEMTQFDELQKYYMTAVSYLTELGQESKAFGEWLENHLCTWWNGALRTRFKKVDQDISISGFHDPQTTKDLFSYLREENMLEDCLRKFNSDFLSLFSLIPLYAGKDDSFAFIAYDDAFVQVEHVGVDEAAAAAMEEAGEDIEHLPIQSAEEKELVDFMNEQVRIDMCQVYDAKVVVTPTMKHKLAIGNISPVHQASYYGALRGAFKHLEPADTFIRLVNGAGQMVTVVRDVLETGDRFTVIDIVTK